MRSRFPRTVALAVAAVLGMGACSGEDPDTSHAPTAGVPTTSAGSVTPTGSVTMTGEAAAELSLPPGRSVLVPLKKGTSGTRVRFTRRLPNFAVHLVCAGGGSMTVQVSTGRLHTWPCDGVPNQLQVLDDDKKQKQKETLTLSVRGKANWQLGVVDGAP